MMKLTVFSLIHLWHNDFILITTKVEEITREQKNMTKFLIL